MKNSTTFFRRIHMGQLLMVFFLLATGADSSSQATANPVRLNQVGFLPKAQKLAVITAAATVDSFALLDQQQRVVYRGALSTETKSEWSPLKTRVADFTSFASPGVYTISIQGLAASWP
ncbi:MAG: hypothetical protein EOO09_06695, partial [Chitinophagaceae bacterium]